MRFYEGNSAGLTKIPISHGREPETQETPDSIRQLIGNSGQARVA
jgi:hypothetical protein